MSSSDDSFNTVEEDTVIVISSESEDEDSIIDSSVEETFQSAVASLIDSSVEENFQSAVSSFGNSKCSSDDDSIVGSGLKKVNRIMRVTSSSEEDDHEDKNTSCSNNKERSHEKVESTQNTEIKENERSMTDMSTSEASNKKEQSINTSQDNENARNSGVLKNLGRQSYRELLAIINSRSPSPVSEDELTIINIDSDDESIFSPTHQSTIREIDHNFKENVIPNEQTIDVSDNLARPQLIIDISDSTTATSSSKLQVSNVEYDNQVQIVENLCSDAALAKKTIKSVNVNALEEQEAKITDSVPNERNPLAWKDVAAQMNNMQPRTLGKRALQTFNTQKALTLDRLEEMHSALNNCPQKDAVIETPKGLKVELMPHQQYAMGWLMWRTGENPSGGILADDLGLGKTLTMIAFTLHNLQIDNSDDSEDSDDETNKNEKNYKYHGGILVVCPASLIYQWSAEISKHIKRGLLSVENYYGANRENNSKRLAKHDFVITTYNLVIKDYDKKGPLFNIKWQHIILDEAHQIRNHSSQTCFVVCNLVGKSRWALTGTPIHNKELDIYALLKFLRCSPFDDLAVWKRWVSDKTTGGQDRLNIIMSSLILRRTKQELSDKNLLPSLPEKTWKLIEISLSEQELNVYQNVYIFSRTLFAQYLHQGAERDTDNMPQLSSNPNDEYYKMHKRLVAMNRAKKIELQEILVLLLRLRQICCHPSLITGMLGNEDDIQDIDGADDMSLLDQLNSLNLEDEQDLAEASKGILNPSNPVFSQNYCSSKIYNIVKLVSEILPTGDKVIIVSQWSSFLHLVASHLQTNNVQFFALDGTVSVSKRMKIVGDINNASHKVQILLLSLTAGGVGLNLVGANHLVLADLHWNLQLDMQAEDIISRMGQIKPVMVYKLLTLNTIEQRIKNLQDNKPTIENRLLTGAKIKYQNKLTLDDLKMLFNIM